MLRMGYTLLLWLALPLIWLRLRLRSRREPGYARNVAERFGRYVLHARRPVIWVHAVSVGEVRAAGPLVAALRTAYPEHQVLVTCMTAAGRETIDQVFGATVLAGFLPYDYPFAVRRFLDHFRPQLGILMETEIWVNLLAACRDRALPVLLANARMSGPSSRAYARLSALMRPAFQGLAEVCAQGEADANRFAALGAHRVSVCGNLKFDVDPDLRQVEAGAAFRAALGGRRVLLFASTREGEERLLLDAIQQQRTGAALLVLVPRHPQRFEEVAAIVAASGLSCVRRSRGVRVDGIDVLLGDTMGEMSFYCAAADVAVIGGSLLPFGGQNLIEACAVGVPVVIGPHMYNFSDAARLALECGAAQQVADAREAVQRALELLDDPERRARMAQAGSRLCATHRGASKRHLAAVRRLMTGATNPERQTLRSGKP